MLRRDLVHALRKKRPEKADQLENIILHQDNAPAHTASSTQLEIDVLGFEKLTHSPYSPDLAPMDFAVFPQLKSELRGIRFADFEQLRQMTLNVTRKMDSKWCSNVYDKWVERHMKCIQFNGVYFEKE